MITAVIPTLNEEEYVELCLLGLKTQTHPPDEIIVVDSGSTDKTVEIAERYTDKVLVGMRNVGYNRQLGVENARGDIILSTDGDTLLEKHWIEWALKTLSNPDVKAVYGRLEPLNPSLQNNFNCAFRNNFLVRLAGFGIHEGCLMFKKSRETTKYFCSQGCPSRGEIRTFLRNMGMTEYEVVHDPNLVAYTRITTENLGDMYSHLTVWGISGYQTYKKKGLLYSILNG